MDIAITLEVPDARAAADFYDTAFGLGDRLAVREGQSPTSGFRGFTVSLVVGGPRAVDGFLARALDAGGRAVKPAKKTLWGLRRCGAGTGRRAVEGGDLLYGRKALAKDAGVAVDGSGSHRIAILGDGGEFVDPDGFRWEALDRSVK